MCFSTLLLRLTLKIKYFELQISNCEIVENLPKWAKIPKDRQKMADLLRKMASNKKNARKQTHIIIQFFNRKKVTSFDFFTFWPSAPISLSPNKQSLVRPGRLHLNVSGFVIEPRPLAKEDRNLLLDLKEKNLCSTPQIRM